MSPVVRGIGGIEVTLIGESIAFHGYKGKKAQLSLRQLMTYLDENSLKSTYFVHFIQYIIVFVLPTIFGIGV